MEKWFDLNIYADFTILQQDAIQRTKWGTNMKDFLKYGQDIGGKQWAILKKIHDTSMDGFVQEQIKSLAGSLESSSEEDDSQKQETFLAKINDFYGELEKASAGQFCSLPTGGARPSPRTVQATSLDATRCISKGGTPNWPKFFERSMELNLAQNDAYITYSCIYHIVIRSQMHIFGFDYENDELHAAAKTCDGEHMLYMARIMKDYKKSGITQEELVYALVKMGKYWSRVFQPMSDEEKALQNFGRSFYDRHTNGPSLSENERKNFCHLILDALNIRWQSKGDAMANLLNKLQEWSTKLQERDDEPAKKLPAPATVATADTLVQAISARTFGVIVQFLAVNFRDEFDHLRQKIKQADPAVPDLIAGFVGRVPNLIAGFVDRPQPAPDAAALLRDAVLESQSHPQEFVPEALRQGLKDKYGRQIVTALRAFRGDMQKVMENMMAANVEFCKAAFKGSVESVAADVLLGGQCLSTMKAAA